MAPFPLLAALRKALVENSDSGHQPGEVAEALTRFFRDARQGFYAGAQSRWQTPLFLEHRDPLALNLARAETLAQELSGSALGDPESSLAALEELETVSAELQSRFAELEAEERTHSLPQSPSPRLDHVLYLWEGRRRGLLPEAPVRQGLEQFRAQFEQVDREMQRALALPPKNESDSERDALEEMRLRTEQLGALLAGFLQLLGTQEPGELPTGSALAELAGGLHQAYQVLEACHPISQSCPFCQGQIALTGRCRSCGRLLPHLDEAGSADHTDPPPSSSFRALHFRELEGAVSTWESSTAEEPAWRALQEEVRLFGERVTQGKRQFEMLTAHPERPVSPDSPERKTEDLLKSAADLISVSYQELSRFALQAYPPLNHLPPNWREPLLEAEQALLEVEQRSSASEPPAAED